MRQTRRGSRFEEICELFRRGDDGSSAMSIMRSLAEVRIVADRGELVAQACATIGMRRAGRRDDAEIEPGEVAMIAELGRASARRATAASASGCRPPGGIRVPLRMKDSQLASAEKRHRRRAAEHVVDRLGAAAERHLDDVGAGSP